MFDSKVFFKYLQLQFPKWLQFKLLWCVWQWLKTAVQILKYPSNCSFFNVFKNQPLTTFSETEKARKTTRPACYVGSPPSPCFLKRPDRPQPWTREKTAMERRKVSAAFLLIFIPIDLRRRSFLRRPTWKSTGRAWSLEFQIGENESAKGGRRQRAGAHGRQWWWLLLAAVP
jgi:hypothetical protein